MNYQGGYSGQAPQQPYYGGHPQGYPGSFVQQPVGGYGSPSVPPEVLSWFRAVDQDNSGFINADELSRALLSGNNRHFSAAVCATMIGMFDHQRSGRIDVFQFSQLYTFITQWTEAFRQADSDKSGSITANELQQVLQRQGYNISPQTVQLMIHKFGQVPPPTRTFPQPGQVSLGLDGFILVNVQLKRLTDCFRAKDTQMQGRITISYEDFIAMVVNTVA